MKHLIFVALFLVGQVAAPVPTYKGVMVQPVYVCGAEHATPALRVAVVGNSLAWSPPQDQFGWTRSNGMAATSLENDYAHDLCRAIASKQAQTVALLVVQAWAAERAITMRTQIDPAYYDIVSRFDPHLLVVQFSDNVRGEGAVDFSAKYEAFVGIVADNDAGAEAPALVCVGPWYTFVARYGDVVKPVCERHGGAYVPIVDIYQAGNARASSFDSEINSGVGDHPNDLGMAEIASRIYETAYQRPQ